MTIFSFDSFFPNDAIYPLFPKCKQGLVFIVVHRVWVTYSSV